MYVTGIQIFFRLLLGHSRMLLIPFAWIVIFQISFGQTTLYTEDFNSTALGKGIDGVTVDMSGITNWTIAYTGSWSPMASGEYFKVVDVSGNKCFESCNTDAPGNSPAGAPTPSNFSTYCVVWSSTVVSTSGYSNVSLSVDLTAGAQASTSGCIAYYSIDGGSSWISFSTLIGNGSVTGGSVTGLCGSDVQIKVAHWGTTSARYYRHDNVLVQGTAVPEPASHPASFSASPNGDCTKMDLSFSAASSIINANGYVIIQRQGALPTGTPSDRTSYIVGNTIGDGTVVAFITSTATTSATVTGQAGSTNYYYKIFPYYYDGSNSCTYNYYTGGSVKDCNATTGSCVLSPEPTTHPASFTATKSATCEQLDLGFSAGSTITNFYGYLILRKQGSAPTGEPIDATAYSVGNTIGDGKVIAKIISSAVTSYTDTSMSDTTQFYYSIFPYNYDGADPLSHNYKTTGYLTCNEYTKYCPVVVGDPTPEAGYDDPKICFHGGQANWWSVNLYDNADMHGETTSKTASTTNKIITSVNVDLHSDATFWTGGSPSTTPTNSNIYMANYSNVSSLPSEYSTEAALDAGTGVTWTLVYSGNVSFSGYGWNTIPLSSNFNYIGTGSLLVKFTRVSGNTPASFPYYGYLDASPTSEIRQLNKSYDGGSSSPSSYKYLKIGFNGITSSGALLLPIELTRFEGECNKNKVVLFWQTATETNNHYFIIERSDDGRKFQSIGTLYGAGNSSSARNYAFTDEEDFAGLTYYRLQQVDFDGKSSFSEIIAVDHSCVKKGDVGISVYPNPASDVFVLELKLLEKSEVSVEIYSGIGKLEKPISAVSFQPGIQTLQVETEGLLPGVHFIKLSVNKQDYFRRFIKL